MDFRREDIGQEAVIRAVVEAAFGRSAEARLVDALRAERDAVVSVVALDNNRVVGHAMLSRMTAPFPALGLAPVAVEPARQRQGIGSGVVRHAISQARSGEWACVFVLGAPRFYERFGFTVEQARGFESSYAGAYFMALALRGALPVRSGRVDYAPAFATLG